LKRTQRGFTLIELMITVAVVAILAALAYPAYTDQMRKGVRRAAQAQMMDLANREQQFLLANRTYVDYMMDLANREQQFLLANRTYVDYPAITASGYALPPEVSAGYTPSIVLATGTFPAYTITFTAKARQLKDGDLTLNHQGVKTPADKW
jgi:type IV pilus assembly protein PilE